MSTATAARRPSPQSPWERSSSPNRSQMRAQKSSTTPFGLPSRTPASVGQTIPPLPSSRQARPPLDPRTSSPNYFGFVVDPTIDLPNSSDARQASNAAWSPPTSSIRSVGAAAPKYVAMADSMQFDAIRRKSESKPLNLGHGSLSQFSLSVTQKAQLQRPAELLEEYQDPSSPRAPTQADGEVVSKINILSSSGAQSPNIPLSSTEINSFFNQPRYSSPAQIVGPEGAENIRAEASHLDDRHSRLSLPTNRLDPPPSSFLHHRNQRASTLPLSIGRDGPTMAAPQHIADLLNSSEENILLLDLRAYRPYSHSRISKALNLCIPTTLLKRPSYNVDKLTDTFDKESDKTAFRKWKECQYIVVYDAASSELKDAISSVNTLKKFTTEGWKGIGLVIKGGFSSFSKAYPKLIDGNQCGESSNSSRKSLSIVPAAPGAQVAGGCVLPPTKNAANPFFGNIRQNMDLIGGVGQIPITCPPSMTPQVESDLPLWLRRAIDKNDAGKAVSERFLQIERDEQRRMQEALSGKVCYGSILTEGPTRVQIAGIEKGGKNRYNNIWPYDHSRVKLQGITPGGCDYINASHIQATGSNKKYIATQGPLPSTFNDFWRVVWEQDVRVIVMLTAELEGGQLKCHSYWEGKAYGPLRLKLLSERKVALEPSKTRSDHSSARRPSMVKRRSTTAGLSDPPVLNIEPQFVTIRKFTLAHSSQPFSPIREITQLHYTSWPDFGAPAHPSHLLGLVEHCNSIVRSTTVSAYPQGEPAPPSVHPVLVHCSAGCGRTGTFCTVDSVIDILLQQRLERLSSSSQAQFSGNDRAWIRSLDQDLIGRAVENFRDQRLSMVQSLRQFVLCYESVLEWLVSHPQLARRDGATAGIERRSYPGI
ncbi:MAG: hypothetical protein M1829_000556 [Trizodia sp. TS-e1964]|nr:MAG: hypothetical protein M1829_000556 [Trizodia sp. TS-e1964]